jgi:hypothetical protein
MRQLFTVLQTVTAVESLKELSQFRSLLASSKHWPPHLGARTSQGCSCCTHTFNVTEQIVFFKPILSTLSESLILGVDTFEHFCSFWPKEYAIELWQRLPSMCSNKSVFGSELLMFQVESHIKNLRGLSPIANYTDRTTAACRLS